MIPLALSTSLARNGRRAEEQASSSETRTEICEPNPEDSAHSWLEVKMIKIARMHQALALTGAELCGLPSLFLNQEPEVAKILSLDFSAAETENLSWGLAVDLAKSPGIPL